MDILLPAISYALPFVIALIAAMCVVVFGVVALRSPWLAMLPFLMALFWLSENRFGRIDAVASPTLLSRGAGVLLFPAYLWSLLVVLTWARLGISFRKHAPPLPSMALTGWFAAWALLLLAHVAVGAVFNVPFKQSLAPSGFSYIVWLWVLISAMVVTVERPADARRLMWFIIAMGLARAVFGLIRFAAFGGDPANAYANRQGLDLKLTFFDINDSVLCALSISLSLVLLYRSIPSGGWRAWQRALLWAAIVLPAVCIVLSFRRTAWVGTALALGFVLLQLPAKVRWRLVLLALPVILVGIAYAARKRLSQVSGSSTGFFYDLTLRNVGAESPRLLELRLAWQTLLDHPFFGVGSWGSYKGWQQISWQFEAGEGGRGTFLHSGILHVALKTGLVGVILMVGAVITFALVWRRLRSTLPVEALPLAVAGVAGVLFTLPDWIVGTPVSQVRTMLMLGLCVSLPFVAERCYARSAIAGSAEPALVRRRGARLVLAAR